MNNRIIAQNEEIVIGADVHVKEHQVAVVRQDGVLLKNARIKANKKSWESLLERLPGCGITVVYEAGLTGYGLYDLIVGMGHRAVVVAPDRHVGVKTDKRDAQNIARDYLAMRTRAVVVPTYDKRVKRQVLRTRHQMKDLLKQLKNQLKSLATLHGLAGELGEKKDGDMWLKFAMSMMVDVMDVVQEKIKALESALSSIAAEDEYREQAESLMEMEGVGLLCAMEVVLGVADMSVFKKSGQFASFLGLCPGESSSGDKKHQGGITHCGNGRARFILTQCAWSRVRANKEEQERFQKLKARIGARKAIVAMARRLAVQIWWKLKETADSPREVKTAA